jgi:RNA ligase
MIATIRDIIDLATSGCTDWKPYGDVVTDQNGDLVIFNYMSAAQYSAHWNFFGTVSRGLIIDRLRGEVAARPFDKFFNWGEGGRKAGGKPVSITEKVDGSLGILYRAPDGYRIATRGSFHSEQAEWATAFLRDRTDLAGLGPRWTLLFEIVYPGNRVVVDYRGRQDLVLLAARDRLSGEYMSFRAVCSLACRYGFTVPNTYAFASIDGLLARLETLSADEEGFVVEFEGGERFKFKGRKYLELHRLICGLSFKSTLAAVVAGTAETCRALLPEEFALQFDAWETEICETANRIAGETQALFAEAPKSSRKEFALWVQENHRQMAPYLFAMYDGKPLRPVIYKRAFVDRQEAEGVGIKP